MGRGLQMYDPVCCAMVWMRRAQRRHDQCSVDEVVCNMPWGGSGAARNGTSLCFHVRSVLCPAIDSFLRVRLVFCVCLSVWGGGWVWVCVLCVCVLFVGVCVCVCVCLFVFVCMRLCVFVCLCVVVCVIS